MSRSYRILAATCEQQKLWPTAKPWRNSFRILVYPKKHRSVQSVRPIAGEADPSPVCRSVRQKSKKTGPRRVDSARLRFPNKFSLCGCGNNGLGNRRLRVLLPESVSETRSHREQAFGSLPNGRSIRGTQEGRAHLVSSDASVAEVISKLRVPFAL